MQAAQPIEPQVPIARPVRNFEFTGNGLEYFLLLLKNFFLTLLTLGIYYPWAITRSRIYFWNHTELAQEFFDYRGTGKELFFGYLKVLGIYLTVIIAQALMEQTGVVGAALSMILLFGFFIVVVPFAIYGSFRYRLSRTSYLSLPFQLKREGQANFVKNYMLDLVLTMLTFGIYLPVFMFRMTRNLIDNISYGGMSFHYSGKVREEYLISLGNFFLIILTLGLFYPWAVIRKTRYRLENTKIDEANFRFHLRGSELLLLNIGFVLGLIFSLGLAFPWLKVWMNQKIMASVDLVGAIDLVKARLTEDQARAAMDSAGDFLDAGIGLGI